MNTYKKIIFIIIDILTFGIGVPLLIEEIIRNIIYFKSISDTFLGVFLITLGLLIHYWGKIFFNINNEDLINKKGQNFYKMRIPWKIIFIIVDVILFGIGTPFLITSIINNYYYICFGDVELAAFMVTLGFLIHYWRKNYFRQNSQISMN